MSKWSSLLPADGDRNVTCWGYPELFRNKLFPVFKVLSVPGTLQRARSQSWLSIALHFSQKLHHFRFLQTMAHIKPCDSSCGQSDDNYSDKGSALISWLGWRSICLDYNVFVVACALYMTSANPLLKGNCGLGPVQYIICKWISFFAKIIIDISY